MGNLFSASRQRSHFEIGQSDKELVRMALQTVADEAKENAKLARQKYERRKMRYEAGYGQNGQPGKWKLLPDAW